MRKRVFTTIRLHDDANIQQPQKPNTRYGNKIKAKAPAAMVANHTAPLLKILTKLNRNLTTNLWEWDCVRNRRKIASDKET